MLYSLYGKLFYLKRKYQETPRIIMDSNENKLVNNNLAMMVKNKFTAPYTFSGKRGEDGEKFINDLERYLRFGGFNEQETWMIFMMSLQGEAKTWARTLKAEIFEEAVNLFRERFIQGHPSIIALDRMVSLQINQFSSVLAYLDEMNYQAKLGTIDEVTLVGLAIKSLPRNQSNQLMLSLGGKQGISWEVLYSFCQKLNLGISENLTCFLVKTSPKKKLVCYFCGKAGHKVNQCFKLKMSKGRFSQIKQIEEVASDMKEDHVDELNKDNLLYSSVMIISSKVPKIMIKINDKPISCLVDTGCELNLIHEKLISKKSLKPTNIRLMGANSSALG